MEYQKHFVRISQIACGLLYLLACLSVIAEAQKPQLMVQTGHVGRVPAVAISPDGKLLASAGEDHTIRIWDLKNLREARRIVTRDAWIVNLLFANEGKYLVSAAETIKIWDVATGELIKEQPGQAPMALSADGQLLAFRAMGHSAGDIHLWRLRDFTELEPVRGFTWHEYQPCQLAFIPGSSTLAAGCVDQTIKFWNLETRSEIKMTQSPLEAPFAVSPDGTKIASQTGSQTGALFQLTSVKSGRRVGALTIFGKLKVPEQPEGEERPWDAYLPNNKSTVTSFRVSAVIFSPKGRFVASLGYSSRTYVILVWDMLDVEHPQLLRVGPWDGEMTFSADEQVLASGNGPRRSGDPANPRVWDMPAGQERQIFGRAEQVRSIAFSPNGDLLANGRGNTVEVWDFLAGRQVTRFGGTHHEVNAVTFSPDGDVLASVGDSYTSPNTIQLRDLKNDNVKVLSEGKRQGLSGLLPHVKTVSFSPNGKYVAVGRRAWGDPENGNSITVWDVKTKKELYTIVADTSAIQALAFSPNSEWLASGSGAESRDDDSAAHAIKFWNATSGKYLFSLPGHKDSVTSISFSNNGKLLASCGVDQTVRIWDLQKRSEFRTLSGHVGAVNSVVFSKDDSTVLSGGSDATVRLWNVEEGKEKTKLSGHTNSVRSVAISSDGKLLATGGEDAVIKVWDIADLTRPRDLATLFSLTNETWVVADNEGRFNTNNLEDIPGVNWILPDNPLTPLPIEIFMRPYYEPRLLPRVLQHQDFESVPSLSALNRVQPKVVIDRVLPDPNDAASVKVTVTLTNEKGEQERDGHKISLYSGASDVHLFRDGQLVGYALGEAKFGAYGTTTILFSVKLPRKKEKQKFEFTAYAFNSDRVKSATAKLVYDLARPLPTVKGRAYVISVGVNVYQDSSWDLKFAARDAEISEAMLSKTLAARGDYEVVGIKLTSNHTLDANGQVSLTKTASKRNFQTVLETLANGPEKADKKLLGQVPGAEKLRKVQPEDLVLITFSSHGYTDKQGKFYLMPYDTGEKINFTADGQIASESLANFISSDDLSEWLRDIDAGELVMIVDTCHSAGAVEEPGFKAGPMGSRGLGQLAYDKGMIILAASQADDVALELDRLQQGLLTYALMEGLNRGTADDTDEISLEEWLQYGAERVPTLYRDVKAGKLKEIKSKDVHITAVVSGASLKKNAFQQPQLFDFLRHPGEVVLTKVK